MTLPNQASRPHTTAAIAARYATDREQLPRGLEVGVVMDHHLAGAVQAHVQLDHVGACGIKMEKVGRRMSMSSLIGGMESRAHSCLCRRSNEGDKA